jgi:hypothetical protein
VINNARRSRRPSTGSNIPEHDTTEPEPNSNSNIPRTPPSPTRAAAKKPWLDGDSAFETRTKTTRLNPAAPVFTPSLAHPRRRLLLDDPTTRAFAFGPASRSPADSPGPATPLGPSHVRGAFTFALAARATGRSKGGVDGSPLPFPLGVGKTRVVQPEDVIVGEQGADNVFIF